MPATEAPAAAATPAEFKERAEAFRETFEKVRSEIAKFIVAMGRNLVA